MAERRSIRRTARRRAWRRILIIAGGIPAAVLLAAVVSIALGDLLSRWLR